MIRKASVSRKLKIPAFGDDLLFRKPLPFHLPAPFREPDSSAFWTKSRRFTSPPTSARL
jgi:hypothetical protein